MLFSKWKWDRGRAASLIRGGTDSGSHRSFASTRRRSVHRGRFILRAPFLLSAQFRGGSCQKSGGFHQLGKRAWEEGAPPRSCGVVDLALYLRSLAASKCERREAPSEGPSVDENLPISGRSPQFFCLGSSQRGAACARKRAERHVRLGGHVGRTRCSALRRIRHRHARPCPHKPDSHVRGNASTNSAKASG